MCWWAQSSDGHTVMYIYTVTCSLQFYRIDLLSKCCVWVSCCHESCGPESCTFNAPGRSWLSLQAEHSHRNRLYCSDDSYIHQNNADILIFTWMQINMFWNSLSSMVNMDGDEVFRDCRYCSVSRTIQADYWSCCSGAALSYIQMKFWWVSVSACFSSSACGCWRGKDLETLLPPNPGSPPGF